MARKIWEKGLREGWEKIDRVLHCEGLPYLFEIIRTDIISKYHNDSLVGHFGVKKTRELVARKYYWPTLHADIEAYVKGCDVYIASKVVRYKPYGNLQSFPVPTNHWKYLSMDFITGLSVSTNWKGETYGSILLIVDRLTKMVNYESVMVTINALGLAEVIINLWYSTMACLTQLSVIKTQYSTRNSGYPYATS